MPNITNMQMAKLFYFVFLDVKNTTSKWEKQFICFIVLDPFLFCTVIKLQGAFLKCVCVCVVGNHTLLCCQNCFNL
jgi:hypothetical protein